MGQKPCSLPGGVDDLKGLSPTILHGRLYKVRSLHTRGTITIPLDCVQLSTPQEHFLLPHWSSHYRWKSLASTFKLWSTSNLSFSRHGSWHERPHRYVRQLYIPPSTAHLHNPFSLSRQLNSTHGCNRSEINLFPYNRQTKQIRSTNDAVGNLRDLMSPGAFTKIS